MNPFRRIWPREIALYLAALALFANAAMGIAHAGHVFARAEAILCAAEHAPEPADAPVPACQLCQVPNFAGPAPADAALAAPVAWGPVLYSAPASAPTRAHPALPHPARGPPASV